jgi:hypothetical protein
MSRSSFTIGVGIGIVVASLADVIAAPWLLDNVGKGIYDHATVQAWKAHFDHAQDRWRKEECVEWDYSLPNKREGDTLTVYYTNQSWLSSRDDINDLCAFVNGYPTSDYTYHLDGREDFAERLHSPSTWKRLPGISLQNSQISTPYTAVFLRPKNPDYVTPRLEGVASMMFYWCDVSMGSVVSSEKFGPRGQDICDTTANAGDRYVKITAIPKDFSAGYEEQALPSL